MIAWAALGLSAALTAGVAFALTPGPGLKASSVSTPSGSVSAMGAQMDMMGPSAMGDGGAATITAAGLTALVGRGDLGARIDAKTNTVTYDTPSVTLVALASPDGQPDRTWQVDGLVNPTIAVQPKTSVDVVVANTDWGYMHGFELTATPPPYPFMSMAGVADALFMMPLPSRTTTDKASASYYTRSASFTTTPGTYHYLCPVPGHAQAGMFGTLVVE